MHSFLENTHIRTNILTGTQVLVSPHRTKRPWQGKEEASQQKFKRKNDPSCYLCPRNTRSTGEKNPNYTDVFVFENDFAALLPEIPEQTMNDGLLKAHAERGICKVVCFSPNHSHTLSMMSTSQIEKIIEVWQGEFKHLSALSFINNIQIFENKGEIMGCSNPHPHGQIWAHSTIPLEIRLKSQSFENHFKAHNHSLLETYLEQEYEQGMRIVSSNNYFVTLVPFWAVWPYETMIIPKKAEKNIIALNAEEKKCFAQSISEITKIYDTVFNVPFPYSSGIHQMPSDGKNYLGWHWHMSFYPPLLRSATVKKYMVGYEMFGMPQRDITPETAAEILKNVKKTI